MAVTSQAAAPRYCRAKATGEAVRHLCLNMGWPRASLYRHVKAAAEAVAEGLNRDRALPLGPTLGPDASPTAPSA
jgi:hypothetical protein